MTLREIEYFLAVVDEGSFTRAAKKASVAQPSLSQQVRALEAELGGQLIERLPRGIRLTAAGRAFLPHARAALLSAEQAGRDARAALQTETGVLEIAAVRSVVVGYLPESMRHWRELHPRTAIRLREYGHRSSLAEAVRTGIGDMAIGPVPSDWSGPVDVLGWHEFVVVLSSEDPLASGDEPLALEVLADREWVLFESQHGLSDLAVAACAKAGFTPTPAVRTTQIEAAARLAAAGIGPAIIPIGVIPAGLEACVHRIAGTPGYEIAAYTRRDWSPMAAAFLRVLEASGIPPRPPGSYSLY